MNRGEERKVKNRNVEHKHRKSKQSKWDWYTFLIESHYTEISRSSVENMYFKRNVMCMYIDLQIRLRE